MIFFLSHCLMQCRDNDDYCIPCIHTIYAMLSSGMLLLIRTSTILLSRTSFNANKRFSLVMLPLLGGWVLSRIWLTSTVISSWAGKTQEGKRLDNTYMYVRCYCDFLYGLYIAQSQCLDAVRFWWRFSKELLHAFWISTEALIFLQACVNPIVNGTLTGQFRQLGLVNAWLPN